MKKVTIIKGVAALFMTAAIVTFTSCSNNSQDEKIKSHPIKFGRGDWTCVVGIMEGTFSKPMSIGNGKSIPPTNKSFKLSMTTIGHWGADGKMSEEYLFWDNQAFMKQIGLGQ